MIRRKPVAEVKNDSREKAGLRKTEQEPEDIKTDRASSKSHGDRHQSPRDHHPADPETCSHFVQDNCGGHFEDEVAKEEDARTKAEHLRRQADIFVHGQCRESYIDPIEKGYEIEQHQERNESPRDLANRTFFEEAGSRRCNVAHSLPLAVNAASIPSFLIVSVPLLRGLARSRLLSTNPIRYCR